jgi:hypothetical protein
MTESVSADAYFDAVRLVALLASELHSAVLGGGGDSRSEHWRWMSAAPQPGDLVVELSTSWRAQSESFDHLWRIGRYLGERREVVGEEGDSYVERFDVIVLATGQVFEWTNCSFVRVPEDHLGLLTGTTFWYGSFGGPVTTRSGDMHDLVEYCREQLGVELKPEEPSPLSRGATWSWPRDAAGKPVRPPKWGSRWGSRPLVSPPPESTGR